MEEQMQLEMAAITAFVSQELVNLERARVHLMRTLRAVDATSGALEHSEEDPNGAAVEAYDNLIATVDPFLGKFPESKLLPAMRASFASARRSRSN